MLTNLPRLHEIMRQARLDAVVGTCPENVTYLSGFWAMSQWVRRGPQAYVLQTRNAQEACIVANSGLLDLIPDQEIWVDDIRRYGFFQVDADPSAELNADDRRQLKLFESTPYQGPVEALTATLEARGLARASIGVDELGITPQCMEQLRAALPQARFTPAFALIEKVRSVKTAAEIERLSKVIRKNESDIAKLRAKLGNESFVKNAKPELVAADRARLAELEAQNEGLAKQLERVRRLGGN